MSHAPGPFTPDAINWQSQPRPSRSKKIEVFKVLPGDQWRFRVLSHRVLGVDVHFDGDRSVPCTARSGKCWFPHELGRTRRQAWLYVWSITLAKNYLLCLTEEAWKRIKPVADAAASIRGGLLVVWRQGKGLRGAMRATLELNPERCDPKLDDDIDLAAHLVKMWNAPLTDPEKEGQRQQKYADLASMYDEGVSPFADDDDTAIE